MTDELRRTAHHESGHAVAEWCLGFRIEIVSIRPHERYAGFAAFERLPFSTEGWDPFAPVTLAPHELRRQVERLIVVALAGAMAETLAGPPSADAPVIPPDEQDATDMAQHVARLAPRHRELLERHEASLSASETSDTIEAERLARAIAGDEEADAYLRWLAKVAARLVHDNRWLIAALAAELLTSFVLPGHDAERIIEAASSTRRKEPDMATLRKSKPLDATGALLEAARTYTPLSPHARGHKVFNPGLTVLRGDHGAVTVAPLLWIATDATTDEKGAALAAHRARGIADLPASEPDPSATRVLGPIPPERRRRALRNYHDKAGRIIHAGQVYDVRDEFVAANDGDLFGPDETA